MTLLSDPSNRSKLIPSRVAVNGYSGTGKTRLVSLLSQQYRLKWIDLDNSKEVLMSLPLECRRNIDYVAIPDSSTVPMAAETLLKMWKNRKGIVCYPHGKYACPVCPKDKDHNFLFDFNSLEIEKDIVVVDTGTQLSTSFCNALVKNKDLEYKWQIDEWGGLLRYTKAMAADWKSSSFNLVVLFHPAETKFDDGRTRTTSSFGSSTMCMEIDGAFNTVVWCEKVNKNFRAYCGNKFSNSIITKSRGGFEIEGLAEPSLLPLFNQIKEMSFDEIAEEKKDAQAALSKVTKLEEKTLPPTNSNAGVSLATSTESGAKPSLAELLKNRKR